MDDCELFMPRGPEPWGQRYVGKVEVRKGLAARFEGIPDVHYGDDEHWVSGNHGVSRWTLTGTTKDGKKISVHGCDLLEFRYGKIVRKDSYWKIVEPKGYHYKGVPEAEELWITVSVNSADRAFVSYGHKKPEFGDYRVSRLLLPFLKDDNLKFCCFCHMRKPPWKAHSLLPSRACGGSFFNFLLFPPPSTT